MESFKVIASERLESDQPVENYSVFQRFQESPQNNVLDESTMQETSNSFEFTLPFNVEEFARLPGDKGRKLTLDNVDIHQYTHDVTEEHQNPDAHYCSLMCTENRISGNHLNNKTPMMTIEEVPNGVFCPSYNEHRKQRQDYILLIGRCISENIPCLEPLKEVAVHHIPHQYSNEMRKATDTVSTLPKREPLTLV